MMVVMVLIGRAGVVGLMNGRLVMEKGVGRQGVGEDVGGRGAVEATRTIRQSWKQWNGDGEFILMKRERI